MLLLRVLFVGACSLIAPTFTRQAGRTVQQRPGASLGAAFISGLLVLPISVILVVLVCVGWPFLALYWILLLLLEVAGLSGLCMLIGEWLARRLRVNVVSVPGLATLGAVALLPLDVVAATPLVGAIGWLMWIALAVLAHGGAMLTFLNSRRQTSVSVHADRPQPGVWTADIRAEGPDAVSAAPGDEAPGEPGGPPQEPPAPPGESPSAAGPSSPIVTTHPRVVDLGPESAPTEEPAAQAAAPVEPAPEPSGEPVAEEPTSPEGEPAEEGQPPQSPQP